MAARLRSDHGRQRRHDPLRSDRARPAADRQPEGRRAARSMRSTFAGGGWRSMPMSWRRWRPGPISALAEALGVIAAVSNSIECELGHTRTGHAVIVSPLAPQPWKGALCPRW